MIKKKNHLFALCLTPLLFVACGGETKETVSSLNTDNYIKVAKGLYASKIEVASPPAPGADRDSNTLYLEKMVKPRDYQVSEIVVQQGDAALSINIDDKNKYATVTLSGDNEAQQTVDMKTFTLSE